MRRSVIYTVYATLALLFVLSVFLHVGVVYGIATCSNDIPHFAFDEDEVGKCGYWEEPELPGCSYRPCPTPQVVVGPCCENSGPRMAYCKDYINEMICYKDENQPTRRYVWCCPKNKLCGDSFNECVWGSGGGVENCANLADDDGDGLVDCGDPDCMVDSDGDGFYVGREPCTSNDCDDNDASINPNAIENCDDGIDNDCDGAVDCADSDCAETCGLCSAYTDWVTPTVDHYICDPENSLCVRDSDGNGLYDSYCDDGVIHDIHLGEFSWNSPFSMRGNPQGSCECYTYSDPLGCNGNNNKCIKNNKCSLYCPSLPNARVVQNKGASPAGCVCINRTGQHNKWKCDGVCTCVASDDSCVYECLDGYSNNDNDPSNGCEEVVCTSVILGDVSFMCGKADNVCVANFEDVSGVNASCSSPNCCDPDCSYPSEVCTDGIDNDCDGLVDGNDTDCCALKMVGPTASSYIFNSDGVFLFNITFRIEGNCSLADYLQVDVNDTNNSVCHIEYDEEASTGAFSGFTFSLEGIPSLGTGLYNVSLEIDTNLPEECRGVPLYITAAGLWQGQVGTGTGLSFLVSSGSGGGVG